MLEIYVRRIKPKKDKAYHEYLVFVNAEKIAEGKVRGHKRSDGWVSLVKRIAEQHEGLRNPEEFDQEDTK